LRFGKYSYQKMSITVFVQHLYEEMIGVKSTSFRGQFIVVSSASEVITVFSLWHLPSHPQDK